jgi:hypothetical protein
MQIIAKHARALQKEEVHARYILACLINLESSRITDPILAILYNLLLLRRGQINQSFLKKIMTKYFSGSW